MPKKKKKKSKVKKKSSKKVKKKTKVKKVSKKIKKKAKSKKENGSSPPEIVIKTKPEWVKASLANKSKYQQKYHNLLKVTMIFGEKKEKELLG